MAATFVAIPNAAIEQMMAQAGFREIHLDGVGERVFARDHHTYRNVEVRVYTSLPKHSSSVRDCGQDRIHVCAVYKTPGQAEDRDRASSRFLFAAQGINRASSESGKAAVEAVLSRTLSRMRDVYGQVNKATRCPRCGEPVRHSKSKRRKSKDGRPNQNYGRAYEACLRGDCNHFRWTEGRKA